MKWKSPGLKSRRWKSFASTVLLLSGTLAGCGPQVADVNGDPTNNNSNDWLGVEDVVQKFQLASTDTGGKLTDGEINARLAAMPRLEEIIPKDRQQFMRALEREDLAGVGDPGDALRLDDAPDTQREVIDLRAFDAGIRNQGSEGLCTAFAAVAAVENLTGRAFKRALNLSERAHWRNYREYMTGTSLAAARKYALIPEDIWPYSRSSPLADPAQSKTARIRDYTELETGHRAVIDSLRSGFPVVIGMGVNRSLMDPADGGIVRAGRASGGAGHAVTIVGAIIDQRVSGGGYYIIKNSWGPDYGDKGYAYVAFDYCEMTYCYVWSVNEVGLFRDGVEVSSLDAPDNLVPVVPTPTPVPSSDPLPSVAPGTPVAPVTPVTPTEPEISIDDFRLVARSMDLYGRRQNQGFYLSVVATPAILREVAAVEYWTSNAYRQQGYFKVTSGSRTATEVDARAFDSMFYPASYGGWTTFPARVTLRDGRKLEIAGARVDF